MMDKTKATVQGGLGSLHEQQQRNQAQITMLVGLVNFAVQPFGSMPRLSNSLRRSRFIHPALLSSPSSFIARDRRSDKSGSKRSCTTFLSFWLSLVDIGVHPFILIIMVINVNHCKPKGKTPQCSNTNGVSNPQR